MTITLCLLTKRLELRALARPSARDGKVFFTQAQLAMLLEGIDWRQPKRLLTSWDYAVPSFILRVGHRISPVWAYERHLF
ncbi:IS66 family insertion sequence element accessory protein TnpB [Escherichia coli]